MQTFLGLSRVPLHGEQREECVTSLRMSVWEATRNEARQKIIDLGGIKPVVNVILLTAKRPYGRMSGVTYLIYKTILCITSIII